MSAEDLKKQANEKFKEGNYAIAITLYTQAIEMNKEQGHEDPVYYANRANANFQLGDFMAAREDAEYAIKIDPKYIKGYWRLAEVCRCTFKQEEALENYKKAFELNPKSRQIAEQINNTTAFINAQKRPKPDFFRAIHGIPQRSFSTPNTLPQMQPSLYPGLNPFGTTGTAPATVNETGRDFVIPDNIQKEYPT